MIENIIDAISVALNREFGNDYAIYSDEDIEQGLSEPCFFIALITSSQNRVMLPRFYCENSFDITYFPKRERSNSEMLDVAEKLFDCLELIALLNGDLIRGTSMRYQIIDGVLHFFISYNIFLREVINHIDMQDIKLIQNIGGN